MLESLFCWHTANYTFLISDDAPNVAKPATTLSIGHYIGVTSLHQASATATNRTSSRNNWPRHHFAVDCWFVWRVRCFLIIFWIVYLMSARSYSSWLISTLRWSVLKFGRTPIASQLTPVILGWHSTDSLPTASRPSIRSIITIMHILLRKN